LEILEHLAQQFNRLSELEKTDNVLVDSESRVSLATKMAKEILPRVSQRDIEAIESLQRRSLIEKKINNFVQEKF
jgi:preprotein translocase subunit Sec63